MQSYISQINKEQIPRHVAIIMDGNGRWAKSHGKQRTDGHQSGSKTVRQIVEAAAELNIDYLTLYAFSSENWNRPEQEVGALMNLLIKTINEEQDTLTQNNIRLKSIGDTDRLPESVREALLKSIELTASNTGLTLVLALSYGARQEITHAAKMMAEDIASNKINPSQIDEYTFCKYLQSSFMPDPELLIRTSGEVRISNFLLWQLAYAELYFTDVLWPDFSKEHFFEAIYAYQQRERRLGKTSEQIAGINN